ANPASAIARYAPFSGASGIGSGSLGIESSTGSEFRSPTRITGSLRLFWTIGRVVSENAWLRRKNALNASRWVLMKRNFLRLRFLPLTKSTDVQPRVTSIWPSGVGTGSPVG